jgi:hypothetical protein
MSKHHVETWIQPLWHCKVRGQAGEARTIDPTTLMSASTIDMNLATNIYWRWNGNTLRDWVCYFFIT